MLGQARSRRGAIGKREEKTHIFSQAGAAPPVFSFYDRVFKLKGKGGSLNG
jgi:hypothetical protein